MKNSTSIMINEELNHTAWDIYNAIEGQADPTNRVIGSDAEEWVEYAKLDGINYAVYSIFEGHVSERDPEDLNWSIDNVTRIEAM